jgi:periplasmic divalent cation tolerance protein
LVVSAHAVVLTTAPSEHEASRIAAELVERRLAACVNVVPKILSTYRWEEAVHVDEEWLLLIKTRRERFEEIRAAIVGMHSYQRPEVVMVGIEDGDPAYLAWIDASVR